MENIKQLLDNHGESVYPLISEQQIEHKADKKNIGEMTELATEIKSSLVLAINENVANIERNTKDISLLPSEQDITNQMTDALKKFVKLDELEDLVTATAIVITINDSLLDVKNNKADKSEIPTKLSELTNDKGFVTNTQLAENKIIQKIQADILDILENIGGLATKEEVSSIKAIIPKKTSDLINDSLFITKEDEEFVNISSNVKTLLNKVELLASKEDLNVVKDLIPTKVSELSNDSGFITKEDVPTGNMEEIQSDIESLKLTKAEKEFVSKEVKRLDDLIEAIEIPEGTDVRPIMKLIEELKEGKADKGDIPTKVSEIQNDLEFLTKSDIDTHATIIKVLSDIGKLYEMGETHTQSLSSLDSQLSEMNKTVESNTNGITSLQVEVASLDTELTTNKTKVSKLEEAQISTNKDVKTNKDQIQINKESIRNINVEIQSIPKQTSDLVNDSGFITKENVIGMDLKDNQSIKNLETKKANKADIPTKLSELDGLELLQTKTTAKEEHALIQENVNKKANKTDIPTKLTDLENDMNLVTEDSLNSIKKDVTQNTLDISTIQNAKRVYVSKNIIPIEDRIEGNLYLQFGQKYGRIEDSVGDKVLLETNKIVEVEQHPLEKKDGQMYVLTTNGKAYITLGETPKQIALTEDINKETQSILDTIKAIQSDVSSMATQVSTNIGDITKLSQRVDVVSDEIGGVNKAIEGHTSTISGIGQDVITLKEKDKSQDSKITELEINKSNKQDVALEVSRLDDSIKAKANKIHDHNMSDITGLSSKLGQLEEQITSGSGVKSVNGKTGAVTLSGSDILVSMSWSESISDVLWDMYNNKADKGHTHTTTNITGLEPRLTKLEEQVPDGGGVTSVNTLTGDVVITGENIPFKEGIDKPMAECMLESVEGLNRLIEQKADKYHTHTTSNIMGLDTTINSIQSNKANKSDIPTKLSQLEQDIDMGSEFVIPRNTEDYKDGEIYVTEMELSQITVNVDKKPENVKQEGTTFTVGETEKYTDIDLKITSGKGNITLFFKDTSGYYSYTIYHVNKDRVDSGWMGDEKEYTHTVEEGDRIIISTGDPMICGYKMPKAEKQKVVMFNGSPIAPKFDDSSLVSQIKEVKDGLDYKANKSDIPKNTSDLVNDSGFVTKDDMPKGDSFKKFTQTNEPENLSVGDEWHKIIQ